MQCPTCGQYGDLIVAQVRRSSQHVLICTECDLLWVKWDGGELLAEEATSVSAFLAASHIPPNWDELLVLEHI